MRTSKILKLVVFALIFTTLSLSLTTITAQGTRNGASDAGRQILKGKRVPHKPPKQGKIPRNQRPAVDSVRVSQNGRGYKTINEALVELNNRVPGKRFVVRIEAGTYNETVHLERHQNVTFIGAGIGKTVITGHNEKLPNSSTWEAATVVVGEGFFARNLTFQNTALTKQAPAIATRGRAAFWRVELDAYQDTIYASSGTQFFSHCRIAGSVDMISADKHGNIIIQKSRIYVKLPQRHGGRTIYISASNRHATDPATGIIVFLNNKFSTKVKLGKHIHVFLGRAWGPAAKTVYIRNQFNVPIQSALGPPMIANSSRYEYFGEFGNTGRNYHTGSERKQMSLREANNYTVGSLIPGAEQWLHGSLGVPFVAGV